MAEFLHTSFLKKKFRIIFKAPEDCNAAYLTPAEALAGAKYTIAANDDSSDHSSADSSDSESDSEPSDSDLDLDVPPPPQDKRKVDKGKGKASGSPTPSAASGSTAPAVGGSSVEKTRENYIQQHRELAQRLKTSFEEKHPDMRTPEPKKRARKAKAVTDGPARKSSRLANDTMDTDNPDSNVDGTLNERPRPRPTFKSTTASTSAAPGSTASASASALSWTW
ncbi:hypothetical protein B0H13DRAFT_1851342 [Mycena leptocephala]|nr:hypothetical protein B0H13DRAFT_1851342 [Mycena leptocephala]